MHWYCRNILFSNFAMLYSNTTMSKQLFWIWYPNTQSINVLLEKDWLVYFRFRINIIGIVFPEIGISNCFTNNIELFIRKINIKWEHYIAWLVSWENRLYVQVFKFLQFKSCCNFNVRVFNQQIFFSLPPTRKLVHLSIKNRMTSS